MAQVRHKFYIAVWLLYVTIVGLSTLVAIIRYAVGEEGTLHHIISMVSNHLVLVNLLLADWTNFFKVLYFKFDSS